MKTVMANRLRIQNNRGSFPMFFFPNCYGLDFTKCASVPKKKDQQVSMFLLQLRKLINQI